MKICANLRIIKSLYCIALASLAVLVLAVLSDRPAAPEGTERPFAYDVDAYRHIEPALLKYKELNRIALPFHAVHGLALGADRSIWVAGDSQIAFFDAAGERRGGFTTPEPARALTVLPPDGLLLAMQDHVEQYAADGKRLAAWPSLGSGALLTSLAVTPDSILAADSGRRRVHILDRAGAVRGALGRPDPARDVPGLILPSPHLDLAPSSDGSVFINNPGRHIVERYTLDGERMSHLGRAAMTLEGFCGCCNPVSLALLPDGNLVTGEKGLARVKILRPDGSLESVVAGPEDFERDGFAIDLAVDADGRIYVLDTGSRSVRIFRRKEPHE